MGPARLGMTVSEARKALAMAGLSKPYCAVDILARGGRVIALGTRFGGCFLLSVPRSAFRWRVVAGIALLEMGDIGGSSAPLVRAFGPPSRFRLAAPVNVLLWPNGLVARTAAYEEEDEVVTYLAVVAPRAKIPPYPLLSAAP